jgi:hypothetical protein
MQQAPIMENPALEIQEVKPVVVIKEKAHKKKRIKVMRPSEIVSKARNIYPFEGKFFESFGKPEKYAKWFITGPSFSGKSYLLTQLCDYFSQFGLVDYNNHEESGGDSETVSQKIMQTGDLVNNDNVRYYKAPLESDVQETFFERLRRRSSATFAVLDSMQHAEMSKKIYLHYTEAFCTPKRGKNMLFVSHWVKNDFTKFVKHDCDIKIEVIGFVASVESRYGGSKPFVIWESGARAYWNKNFNKVADGKYWPGKKK